MHVAVSVIADGRSVRSMARILEEDGCVAHKKPESSIELTPRRRGLCSPRAASPRADEARSRSSGLLSSSPSGGGRQRSRQGAPTSPADHGESLRERSEVQMDESTQWLTGVSPSCSSRAAPSSPKVVKTPSSPQSPQLSAPRSPGRAVGSGRGVAEGRRRASPAPSLGSLAPLSCAGSAAAPSEARCSPLRTAREEEQFRQAMDLVDTVAREKQDALSEARSLERRVKGLDAKMKAVQARCLGAEGLGTSELEKAEEERQQIEAEAAAMRKMLETILLRKDSAAEQALWAAASSVTACVRAANNPSRPGGASSEAAAATAVPGAGRAALNGRSTTESLAGAVVDDGPLPAVVEAPLSEGASLLARAAADEAPADEAQAPPAAVPTLTPVASPVFSSAARTASFTWPGASSRQPRETRDFLVDDSHMPHDCNTPGLAFRRSKSMDDIIGEEHYAFWGTVITAVDEGDGWVWVAGRGFLPMFWEGISLLTTPQISPRVLNSRSSLQWGIAVPSAGWSCDHVAPVQTGDLSLGSFSAARLLAASPSDSPQVPALEFEQHPQSPRADLPGGSSGACQGVAPARQVQSPKASSSVTESLASLMSPRSWAAADGRIEGAAEAAAAVAAAAAAVVAAASAREWPLRVEPAASVQRQTSPRPQQQQQQPLLESQRSRVRRPRVSAPASTAEVRPAWDNRFTTGSALAPQEAPGAQSPGVAREPRRSLPQQQNRQQHQQPSIRQARKTVGTCSPAGRDATSPQRRTSPARRLSPTREAVVGRVSQHTACSQARLAGEDKDKDAVGLSSSARTGWILRGEEVKKPLSASRRGDFDLAFSPRQAVPRVAARR